MPHNDEPRFVGIRQAAGQLGLARSTIYNLMAAGQLKSVHVGRRRLIPVGELDRYEAELLEQMESAK